MTTTPSVSSGPPRILTSDQVLAVVDLAWNGPIGALPLGVLAVGSCDEIPSADDRRGQNRNGCHPR